MNTVRARLVRDSCPDCKIDLLKEATALGGLPLSGEIVLIPEHWLSCVCPHGRAGLEFELLETTHPGNAEESATTHFDTAGFDSRMDATKNIGYPVREHGPYGSHPMHDDFDDESDPNGSGSY